MNKMKHVAIVAVFLLAGCSRPYPNKGDFAAFLTRTLESHGATLPPEIPRADGLPSSWQARPDEHGIVIQTRHKDFAAVDRFLRSMFGEPDSWSERNIEGYPSGVFAARSTGCAIQYVDSKDHVQIIIMRKMAEPSAAPLAATSYGEPDSSVTQSQKEKHYAKIMRRKVFGIAKSILPTNGTGRADVEAVFRKPKEERRPDKDGMRHLQYDLSYHVEQDEVRTVSPCDLHVVYRRGIVEDSFLVFPCHDDRRTKVTRSMVGKMNDTVRADIDADVKLIQMMQDAFRKRRLMAKKEPNKPDADDGK